MWLTGCARTPPTELEPEPRPTSGSLSSGVPVNSRSTASRVSDAHSRRPGAGSADLPRTAGRSTDYDAPRRIGAVRPAIMPQARQAATEEAARESGRRTICKPVDDSQQRIGVAPRSTSSSEAAP